MDGLHNTGPSHRTPPFMSSLYPKVKQVTNVVK